MNLKWNKCPIKWQRSTYVFVLSHFAFHLDHYCCHGAPLTPLIRCEGYKRGHEGRSWPPFGGVQYGEGQAPFVSFWRPQPPKRLWCWTSSCCGQQCCLGVGSVRQVGGGGSLLLSLWTPDWLEIRLQNESKKIWRTVGNEFMWNHFRCLYSLNDILKIRLGALKLLVHVESYGSQYRPFKTPKPWILL